MLARNFGNPGRRRQALFDGPKLLGGGPPPSGSGPDRPRTVVTFAHLLNKFVEVALIGFTDRRRTRHMNNV
ncbi:MULTISPECIES: hypothetical protein [unclassified Bradyrhizobium]|uniref:hypothetical protein n=1 Tax=unclassified Bradyrhizobium TaxID=2631580 RepID=UPI00047FAB4A|nr:MULTISPECIES: hypothetical protein [unclassified Bradyrhizobium]MCP3460453.1 hypothetical protein [Bradyrhizobium sp. CCGUVB23]